MIELLYLVFLILVSAALGQRILGFIGIKFDKELEKFIFSMPLGLAVLAYITFFIGVAGFLYKSVLMAILLLLFVFLIKDVKSALFTLFKFIKGINKKGLAKRYGIGFNFFTLVIVFLLVFILVNLIGSFVPPWHFDVIAYHLAIQKIYIRAHQIMYIPYIFYSNHPSLIDTVYLVGLLLYNGVLSNLLGYSLAAMIVLAIYSFCKRFFNSMVIGVLASMIFYSFPMVIRGTRTSHIDVQFALFVFLSLYGLFIYFQSGDKKHLVLSAIFAGFGGSSKIFGPIAAIGIFIVLGSYLLLRISKNKIQYKTVIIRTFIFCLIVGAIILPWLLKNYFFTGNPFWPAFNDIFNGEYWDSEHQKDVSGLARKRVLSITNFIRLPWDIHTQTGSAIGNIDYDEGIGPYFMAFLPLYFFLRKKHKIINILFLLLFVYLTMWFFLSHVLRHAIYSWPPIAIISAYVIAELFKNSYISKTVKVLLIFTFSFNLLILLAATAKSMPVALGLETQDHFNLKYPGSIYKASKFINSNLPENAKILLFRDTRGFYLDRDYVWADPLFQLYIDYSKFRNEDDFYKELKKIGITHILVNTEFEWRGQIVYEHRYSPRILSMMDHMLKKYTISLYDEDGILVNELKNK
ncbi:glycosyltransferase family 39 protein [Candidatus Woesearchaeota archaeon]|nr:glycosyltransferase family 39 protein [Candidatus Woesearchaeota archaeon]